MNFYERYIENKEVPLDKILAELDKPIDDREDIRENLPIYLCCAKRYDDLKKLFSHEKYREEAKRESEMHEWLEEGRKRDEEREAKMLKDFPLLKPLNTSCRKIWWICRLDYPYKSVHVENSNMIISGDGFGMAYFYLASEKDIKVIKIGDPEMKLVFEKHQICEDRTISIDVLEQGMEEFAKKINDKMTGFA